MADPASQPPAAAAGAGAGAGASAPAPRMRPAPTPRDHQRVLPVVIENPDAFHNPFADDEDGSTLVKALADLPTPSTRGPVSPTSPTAPSASSGIGAGRTALPAERRRSATLQPQRDAPAPPPPTAAAPTAGQVLRAYSTDAKGVSPFREGVLTSSVSSSAAAAAAASTEDFSDFDRQKMLECVGVDRFSRPILIFTAANVPPSHEVDPERFVRYVRLKFDLIVESDYVIIYLHHGLRGHNKQLISQMWKAYMGFDRKYKKNLKALYLVHTTTFIKVILALAKPIISSKFGQKIVYIKQLRELDAYVHLEQIAIPDIVRRHDATLTAPATAAPAAAAAVASSNAMFGVHLKDVKAMDPVANVPVIITRCVAFLRTSGAFDVEGIFRRSTNSVLMKEIRQAWNETGDVDLSKIEDVHLVAVLMKTFFRELKEPLLTYGAYRQGIAIQEMPEGPEKLAAARKYVDALPPRNAALVRYLLAFLEEVSQYSDKNKMTKSNLAIVFGPNLLWEQGAAANLAEMEAVNKLTLYLLDHQSELQQQQQQSAS